MRQQANDFGKYTKYVHYLNLREYLKKFDGSGPITANIWSYLKKSHVVISIVFHIEFSKSKGVSS